MNIEPLDADEYVRKYRRALKTGDEALAQQLRAEWAADNGGDEDELHQLALESPGG